VPQERVGMGLGASGRGERYDVPTVVEEGAVNDVGG